MRRIQEMKILRGSYRFVIFVVLVSIMVVMGDESKWEEEEKEPFLAYLIDSGEINQEMAELLRTNCRPGLLQVKKTLQDLELCLMKEESFHSADQSSIIKMHETLDDMCPQLKQMLLDCLEQKHLMLPFSGGEAKDLTDSWCTRYLVSLFPQEKCHSFRRELAQKSDKKSAKKSKKKTTPYPTVIAMAVIASVAIAVAVLLICCCCCCGNSSGRGRNDERPLLSLSLSDNSVASSQKSFSLGTSTNEEKLGGNQLFKNKSNHQIETPISAVNFVQAPPGLPPLKPPPGRATPPKPLPSNAAPPPPPPSAPISPPPPPPSGGPRPPPPGAPPPPPIKAGPCPPPPPRPGAAPPGGLKPPRPVPHHPSASEDGDGGAASKAKLKPFFWDKVQASDNSMVWHHIKSGSFQFNEEMMESLFGYAPAGKTKNGGNKEKSFQDPQYVQIIDPKKSQNLSILLIALNVTTEEICDALEEGNELPSELIQTLLRMAPTTDEELKLRLYSGEFSQLGPAERFLKVLVDIPFAFKRLESLLFMCTLQEETSSLKESFVVLEAACTELRKSRLFLKLLEAVLKTGNRMNDGTFRGGAQAFKLDTLLKLSDVKGIDGKTTLLHFVVQEIIRSEGIRAARAAREMRSMSSFKSDDLLADPTQDSDETLRSMGLQVVSGLSSELQNVKKAAVLDVDCLTGSVAKLGHGLVKARDFLNSDMKNVPEENGFRQSLMGFVESAEGDVMSLLEEEKRITALMKSTVDYFHGNAGKDEGLRLFVIVRDFLIILDKVCKEVRNAPRKTSGVSRKEDSSVANKRKTAQSDHRQRLFPAIADRRMDSSSSSSSSDEES